jgi:hypothetical protein
LAGAEFLGITGIHEATMLSRLPAIRRILIPVQLITSTRNPSFWTLRDA